MSIEKFEKFIEFVRSKWNGEAFPGTENDHMVGTIDGIRQQYDMCKAEGANVIWYLMMSEDNTQIQLAKYIVDMKVCH